MLRWMRIAKKPSLDDFYACIVAQLHNGIDRMIDEARQATALGLDPIVLLYLPQVRSHFQFPNQIH